MLFQWDRFNHILFFLLVNGFQGECSGSTAADGMAIQDGRAEHAVYLEQVTASHLLLWHTEGVVGGGWGPYSIVWPEHMFRPI